MGAGARRRAGADVKLQGKVVVVTGAASGIGRAMARRFASEGAAVVAVDVDAARVEKVAEEIGGRHVVADISKQEDIDRMLDGRVDVLCNNAGILDNLTPLADVDDALWNRVMGINVNGPFYACRRVIPRMIEQGGGVILNTCSAAAL